MYKNSGEETKSILVTGGGGFIGGALVRNLIIKTKSKIYNLDKLGYSSDLTSLNLLLKENASYKKRYSFLNVDLRDINKTEEAIKFANPDLIFHLAAESHVDRSIDSPEEFIFSNINGTFNLLNCVHKYWEKLTNDRKNSFRLLHISTDEVFGSLDTKNEPFSEKTPYSPRSPYSASKASSDHLVRAWYHTYGLPTIISNCSNNYGPWQFPEKLIPLVILKSINKEKIPIYGKGENIRDWLFIDDHINALLLIANKAKAGETYCIGGSQEYTNKEVVLNICKILDKLKPSKVPYKNLINYVNDRPGHDLRYAINANKIRNELGWLPKYELFKGLEITIKWYLDNLKWCESLQIRTGYSGQRLGSNK